MQLQSRCFNKTIKFHVPAHIIVDVRKWQQADLAECGRILEGQLSVQDYQYNLNSIATRPVLVYWREDRRPSARAPPIDIQSSKILYNFC